MVGQGEKPMVVAALSGGVDSATAAGLLVEAGHRVVGMTLRLYDARGTAASAGGRCCGPRDIEDARRVCAHLGIPFYVVDLADEFERRVMDDFTGAYLEGRTPNPCARCNQYIKFSPLLQRARSLGAGVVATGHYARIEPSSAPGGYRLRRGLDPDKDQSYFLFAMPAAELGAVRFPLGGLRKDEVRRRAAALGLPNADKPESQEICFVPLGDYRTLLEERRGYAGDPGPIVDASGAVVGTHTGYAHYTVGQRHGLGVALGEAVYVREVRPERNEVVIGRRDEIAARTFTADGRSFIAGEPPAERFAASVRIRHRAADVACEVTLIGDDRFAVETAEPVWAPAPGQAAVLYDGEECLGGGRIVRA